jgi:hypothetical protein
MYLLSRFTLECALDICLKNQFITIFLALKRIGRSNDFLVTAEKLITKKCAISPIFYLKIGDMT